MITGHTGFKGTWISLLLEEIGIPIIGYALEPERNSLFEKTNRLGSIQESFSDIRDFDSLSRCIRRFKPSVILHMAAQPIVLKSYSSPRETFEVNLLGTTNVLDVAFKNSCVQAVLVVTTDKVYKNDNRGQRFVESDTLGGKDPYSASKVGAEFAVGAWKQVAKEFGGPRVVSLRAGNVIGGGDFAENRLLPDVVRSIIQKTPLEIRNPASIRPWQHVLDPIVGYLQTLIMLLENKDVDAINFGPDEYLSVGEIIDIALSHTFCRNLTVKVGNTRHTSETPAESKILKLNSGFAKSFVGWTSKFNTESAVESTLDWWESSLNGTNSPLDLCFEEIRRYLNP